MDEQNTDLSNEAAALADILKWSVDLPGWQRDALRRLCGQTKLEPADIAALVAVCKAALPRPHWMPVTSATLPQAMRSSASAPCMDCRM